MNHIDLKYCNLLATRLKGFVVKKTNPFSANFRCPFCGDSKVSKTKKRGWLLEKQDKVIFYCHNCNMSAPSLFKFLKVLDQSLFDSYVFETKIDFSSKQIAAQPKVKLQKYSANLKGVVKVSSLCPTHPVKKYLDKRLIPHSKHYKLYYSPKFKNWVNTIIPEKFKDTDRDEPRLIMPFIDSTNNVFGVSARSFDPNGLRYITIMFDESKPKIFGLNELDYSKPFNVVEGPIDSLFLDNTIALAGTDIALEKIPQIANATFILDNEPRNKQVCDKIEKLIDHNCKVVIWPKNIVEKDINLMIVNGKTKADIQTIISDRTFSGLQAKLELQTWRI